MKHSLTRWTVSKPNSLLSKGDTYDLYRFDTHRLSVVGSVATLTLNCIRTSDKQLAATAFEKGGNILKVSPDLAPPIEMHWPILAATTPPVSTAIQLMPDGAINLRPIVNVTYGKGTWFHGSVSWSIGK